MKQHLHKIQQRLFFASSKKRRWDPIKTLHVRRSKNNNRPVIIIGGGIAGLSMAWLLQRRGYTNLTILEAESQLGGKIHTHQKDGVYHEMGACYTQPAYHCIHEIMRIFHIHETVGVAGRVVHRDKGEHKPFGEDVIHTIREELGGIWKRLPSQIISARILLALQRYKRLHKKTLGDYDGQLPPQPSQEVLDSIARPFLFWLEHNHLHILIPIFRLFQSAQGYGYLESVPAFYGLMWNTPEVIDIAVEQMRGIGQGAKLLKKGMSQLIHNFEQRLEANIIYHARVVSIQRNHDITVYTKNAAGTRQKHLCSEVFVSSAHRHALQWLEQPTPLEKELFSSFSWAHMTTSLQRSKQPHQHSIDSWFDNLVPGRDHRVITQRNSKAFLSPQTPTTSSICDRVVYQYGEQHKTPNQIDAMFHEHYRCVGVEHEELLTRRYWSEYFPHWSQEGITKANPWRLLASQGKNNTWWIGSSACFESINDVFLYNLQLCALYFDTHNDNEKFIAHTTGAS